MTAPKLPGVGELFAARYRVIRLIGEGAMGVVFEAENTDTQKRVALKILNPELADNREAAERMVREARAPSRVRHQNVVDVYDVLREGEWLFLVMELLEGESLAALLERGGAPAHQFIGLVLAAMRGVAAAHRVGVVHRDLHPGNIFLAREPPNAQVVPKVLDFGISKIRDDRQRALTGSSVAMGTPLYTSYEQLQSARDIDPRTDVYSFGVILYQGLTGQTPFEATVLTELVIKLATTSPVPPKELCPQIPTSLDRLILWALKSDRDARIQSMQEFIDELEPFASERAFLAQMTDAGHTLRSIVLRPSAEPRAFEGIDRPAEQELAPALVRASEHSPERTSDAPRQSEETVVGDELAVPYRSRLLPILLAGVAAVAVLGGGIRLARRFSSTPAHARQVPLPPPLPSLDAGLIAPAAPMGDDWNQVASERAAQPTAPAPLVVDEETAPASPVETEQTRAAVRDARPALSAVSAGADKSKTAGAAVAREPQRGAPRIRAGQVRSRDFLPP